MNKYYKIVENLLKFGANPSLEANNILNLLAQGSLQIQEGISKIPNSGHKLLAWILHEGGIYKNKMAISLISGHGYVNFHLNYV
ncbi:MAG: hypothetical protein LN560_03810 [Rickettsia endosymbiont of Sceptobius lativentris]|nr:hypothetical protein [Rickettsia endosymbiont of Sceptobius lativentris]